MSELRFVSPLMDGMSVEKEATEHNGRATYTLRHKSSGELFILKRISVPASDSLVRALILSGAYSDEASVHEYYGGVVEDIKAELEAGKTLAASGCFAAALSYQVEPKETGIGYDVYILYPLCIPLSILLAENLITNLRAINLGIDLCDAVAACREAGYLFENVKPENIFLMPNGKFLLGDLGLASVEDLKYSSVPEEYIGPYSAPELSDITASPNLTVDLYSLGMVLYRVYNANHGPFEDENTGEVMADKLRLTGKPLPTPLFADYELASIILKACSFQQEERYQSPEEMKQALVMYMQRNEISDNLIVPPIVSSAAPLGEDLVEEAEEEPMRVSSAEGLDETFRESFAPDTSGAGTEEDIDKTIVVPTVEIKKAEATVKAADAPQQATTPPQSAPADDTIKEEAEEKPAEPAEITEEISQEELLGYTPDPDQIDVDELLADLSEVIEGSEGVDPELPGSDAGEETASLHFGSAPLPEEHTYVDTQDNDASPVEEEKQRSKLPTLLALGFLVLAIAAVVCFLVSWYFVEAKELNLVSVSTNELVMQLVVDDPQENFSLTCTDSHGNKYPVTVSGDTYTFTGLNELTTYTITVDAAKNHRLTASSVLGNKVTTPEATEISNFSATRGETDGAMLVSFQHEGPQPKQWLLSFVNANGSHKDSLLFEGNACMIEGLNLNDTYTFTLENTDGCYLDGTTFITYEMIPIVTALNLNISEISGNSVSVTWEAGKNIPETWLVTCRAEGIEPMEQEVTDTTCTFFLQDLSRDYTISVIARGMDGEETLSLSSDLIVVEGLQATYNEDGSVTLSWDTPVGAPDGGWYISYNTVGSLHEPYMYSTQPVTENSVVLKYLIPNAEYEFTLNVSAADAAKQLFGETSVSLKTGEAQPFEGYSLSPKAPLRTDLGYVSLWRCPDKANWKYTDLSSRRTSFGVDQKIAICVQVHGVAASEDEVHVAYVIRNAEGQVINDIHSMVVWNDLWYSRRHASAIPLPAASGESSTPGEYTVEIYFNGQLFAAADFTVK